MQTFESLVALEIPEADQSNLTLLLRCEPLSAVLRVQRSGQSGERRLSRAAPDLARWLALAARELSDSLTVPTAPSDAQAGERASAPPEHSAYRAWLGLRARVGDRPLTWPVGVEIGLGYRRSERLFGAEIFLLGHTANRQIESGLDVRASELGGGAGVSLGARRERFEWEVSLGGQARCLRLKADASHSEGTASSISRAIAGPYAAASLRLWLAGSWALMLRPALTLLWPETRGESQAGTQLYVRKPLSGELTLGASAAF